MIPLHAYANPVVLACLVAGMCAGTVAFGAGQFLPLYFQDSLFVSPTESATCGCCRQILGSPWGRSASAG